MDGPFQNIIIAFIIGSVASLAAVLLLDVGRRLRYHFFYRKFTGLYYDYRTNGQVVQGEVIEVRYRSERFLEARSEFVGSDNWQSCIVMSSANPFQGEGVYTYTTGAKFGLHRILILPERNEIFVHYTNLSGGGEEGAVVWRKATRTPASGSLTLPAEASVRQS